MPTPLKCTILVPVHDERKHVLANIGTLNAAVRTELLGERYEILLLDNGSTDGTEAIAREVETREPEVRFVHIAEKGRGFALRRGFAEACGEYIAILSIDRAWSESFLGAAVRLLDGGVDVVYGPKSHPDSRVSRPLRRSVASYLVRLAVFSKFGVLAGDTQCIKCFRASAIPFLGELRPYNYFAETEFHLRALRAGIACASLPVVVTDHRRDSKVTAASFLEFLREARDFERNVWRGSRP